MRFLWYVEQVAARKVEESDTTFKLFGLLGWFRQLLTGWWHWKRVVRFCHILFIVTIPLWELRDPLASSLLVPGQILVWHPRCFLECVPFLISLCEYLFLDWFWGETPCRSELESSWWLNSCSVLSHVSYSRAYLLRSPFAWSPPL